jgi:hypothetical protein
LKRSSEPPSNLPLPDRGAPLPRRVTFTREIDIDANGDVWTSNSDLPSWQIEGGQPTIIRLSLPKGDAKGS